MPDAFGTRLLRTSATLILAAVFVHAGVSKFLRTGGEVTMIGRFFETPQALRGLGCLEIGLGLWLLSFRTPRLTATLAAGALSVFSVAIGRELMSDNPLPCGCLSEVTPGDADVRQELWLALGRNAFLLLLAAIAIVLAPRDEEDDPISNN